MKRERQMHEHTNLLDLQIADMETRRYFFFQQRERERGGLFLRSAQGSGGYRETSEQQKKEEKDKLLCTSAFPTSQMTRRAFGFRGILHLFSGFLSYFTILPSVEKGDLCLAFGSRGGVNVLGQSHRLDSEENRDGFLLSVSFAWELDSSFFFTFFSRKKPVSLSPYPLSPVKTSY